MRERQGGYIAARDRKKGQGRMGVREREIKSRGEGQQQQQSLRYTPHLQRRAIAAAAALSRERRPLKYE